MTQKMRPVRCNKQKIPIKSQAIYQTKNSNYFGVFLIVFCGNCKDVREGGWHVTTKEEEEEEGRNTHTPA